MKQQLLIFLILCGCVGVIQAQKVTDVDVSQSGKDIGITYDLSEPANIMVNVYVNGKFLQTLKAENVEGDFGKRISAGKNKKIIWHVLDVYTSFEYRNVTFQVIATPCLRTFLMADIACSLAPQLSYGFIVGQVQKYCGWYVKARSSFEFKYMNAATLTCDANGFIDGVMPFYSGKSSKPNIMATGGLLVKCGIPLCVYIGAGYGYRNVLWETVDNQWVKNAAGSYQGVAADFGLMYHANHFAVSVGVSTIQFKNVEFELGLGYVF